LEVKMTDDVAKVDGKNGNGSRNMARAGVKLGAFQANVEVDVTPRGLLAVGFLVSAILLSVAPIVAAATRKVPPAD
jgi:hypothetical protein